ncbi:peptide deformylase [Candidatus Saccharibacteria bacterium]|nr:peptide deformylase [Candidatus Saccharibacteria bacterium]MBI3337742.1 peptide deformylase [Candidatus Saccharibacteria bacterium]
MIITKDSIITLPNPHLRHGSKKIGVVTESIKQLIDNMKDATLDWEDSRDHEVGVALAAIQIDQPLRVVIVRNDFNNKKNRVFTAFINPEITKYEGDIIDDFEGCLSVSDIYGKVPRYEKVRVKAINEDGKLIRVKVEGFLARVFQHEIDHTNGIVFIDHIKNTTDAFYKLKNDGQLEALDYEKHIKDNRILW